MRTPRTLDTKAIQDYVTQSQGHGLVDFFLNVIPSSIVDAFARGDIVQVLFFSVLFGFALSALGDRGRPLVQLLEQLSEVADENHRLHRQTRAPRRVRRDCLHHREPWPRSAHGAIQLMVCVYLTCFVFIVVVPGNAPAPQRREPVAIFEIHSRGTVHRARHGVLRIGAPAHDDAARTTRLLAARRAPRVAGGLLVQHGRLVHLPHDGRDLHRPSHELAPDPLGRN